MLMPVRAEPAKTELRFVLVGQIRSGVVNSSVVTKPRAQAYR
jgi:hypothetical protein